MAAQAARPGLAGFCPGFLCLEEDGAEKAGALVSACPVAGAFATLFFLCALSDGGSKHFPSCSCIRRAPLACGLIGTPEVQTRGRHGAEVSTVKALVGVSIIFTRLVGT